MKKDTKTFIKNILLTFGINAIIYFIIKFFISDYHIITSPLDNKIPFKMYFIYFYMIWYPIEIFDLYLIFRNDRKIFIKTILTLLISTLIADIIFVIYPTMVDRPNIDSFNNITSFITYVVFKCDSPAVNCFPSLHCTFCFILIFANINTKYKYKYLFIFINILIITSTLLTKQHVIIDVIGALIISIINYYIISKIKIFDKIKKQLDL